MLEKIFFHVDVNSAYLSWEAARRNNSNKSEIDIRSIPSVVSGDPNRRSGIVLAKSVPAKKFGIKTGEPIYSARKKCPELYIVPADFDLYVECSNNLIKILKDYSPDVYQYSIDEAFVDMTGTEKLFGNPVDCANALRERVKRELGFSINIGISNNMVLAKMAGDFSKPDKTHTLFKYEIEEKLWPLPIEDLFFVGRKTAEKLKNMGITKIGDLAKSDLNFIKKHLKSIGEIIYNHANGRDGYTFLKDKVKNKSIGNSTTTTFDISDKEVANRLMLSLCETVCARLRKKQMSARVVSVEIVDMNFKRMHMQKKLNKKTNLLNDIYQIACEIFVELWNGIPLRHLGVSASHIESTEESQLSFFDTTYSKEDMLYKAVDEIREKYGEDSVIRASFLEGDIGHMEGGTSKNKKNGIVYL